MLRAFEVVAFIALCEFVVLVFIVVFASTAATRRKERLPEHQPWGAETPRLRVVEDGTSTSRESAAQ